MSKLLTAQKIKRLCFLNWKDIKHLPCQERYDMIIRNANAVLKQGAISQATHTTLVRYATEVLLK